MSLLYFWEFDIDPAKTQQFKSAFSDLRAYNKGLPSGTAFVGLYETFIGQGPEPKIQVMFVTPSMAEFDAAGHAEGIRTFHKDIAPFLIPGATVRNRLLKAIGVSPIATAVANKQYDGDNPWHVEA